MTYALGVILFAFGLLFSVCLHEAGHMVAAKIFGMRVTRYFVGFGTTLWSFRRGDTEYGIKAIPAGGFVSVVGMHPGAPEPEAEETEAQGRAFWQKPLWQRTVVLVAGAGTHIVLAVILLIPAFTVFGIPTPRALSRTPTVIGDVAACVIPNWDVDAAGSLRACKEDDPKSPAALAGLKAGDRITAIDGVPTPVYKDFQTAIRKAPTGTPIPIAYVRDGVAATARVTLAVTQRPPLGSEDAEKLTPTPTIGISNRPITDYVKSGPVAGVGKSVQVTGQTLVAGFKALGNLPSRIGPLFQALTGGERSPEDPISVVGASRLGGEVVADQGEKGGATFLSILASLNVFLALFNLLPLPPLDGGHVVVGWYEAARRAIALRRHRPDPGPVDRERLVPLTLTVVIIFGAFALLTLSADIVNPIRLN